MLRYHTTIIYAPKTYGDKLVDTVVVGFVAKDNEECIFWHLME